MGEPDGKLDCSESERGSKISGSSASDGMYTAETVENLQNEIEKKDNEIGKLRQLLERSERQLEKANNYNEDLRKELSNLSSELHKYRNVVRKAVCIQVAEGDLEEAYGNKPMPEWGSNLGQDAREMSIADSLKAAAEAALQNQQPSNTDEHMTDISSEYVYDAASGFYYHPPTGYYWDPTSGLFYDYTTGTYYKYNDQTGEYDVHSKIDVTNQSQMFARTSQEAHGKEHKKHKRRTKKKASNSKSLKDAKKRRAKFLSRHSDAKSRRKSMTKVENEKVINDVENEKEFKDESSEDAKMESEGKPRDNNLEERDDEKEDIGKDSDCDSESSGSLATGESELMSEPESGEISSESSSDLEIIAVESAPQKYNPSTTKEMLPFDEIADNHPPCIRVIVQESDHLDLGSLYIITCAGGSIGREPNMGHAIEIHDLNISKLHAQIQFDYERMCYTLLDKGSQNGTVLNGNRLSRSKSESDHHALHHGDILQIGNTKLLFHIHKGHETCDDCEPGQVQAKLKASNPIKNDYVVLSQEEKNRQRKKELKNIKKKYGLQNARYEDPGAVVTDSDYCDKAYMRRKFIGSEANLPVVDESPASVQTAISASNKGHKLLAKMGWKEGEGLGKTSSGIAEPISVEMRANQTAGLGSAAGVSVSLDNVQQSGKAKRWGIARQRYEKLQAAEAGPTPTIPTYERSLFASASSQQPVQSTGAEHIENISTSEVQSMSHSVYDCGDTPGSAKEVSTATSPTNMSLVIHDPYTIPGDGMQSSSSLNIPASSQTVQQLPQTKTRSKPKISWVKGGTEHVGQVVPPNSHSTSSSTSSRTEEHPP